MLHVYITPYLCPALQHDYMSLLYFGNSTFLAHGSFFLFFDPRITFAWSPSIISCPCLAVLMFVCPHSFGVSYLHVTISASLHIYIFTYLNVYILSFFPHFVFSYYPTNLFWVPEINCYECPPTLLCIFVFPRRMFCNHLTTFLCPHVFIPWFQHFDMLTYFHDYMTSFYHRNRFPLS